MVVQLHKAKTSLLLISFLLIQTGCATFTDSLHNTNKQTNRLQLRSIDQQTKAEACRLTAVELASHAKDEHAIAQFEQARKLDPDMEGIAYPLAVLYDRQGRIDAAQREYEQALLELPKNADLRNDFGYFFYSRQMYADAQKQLEQALKLNKNHPKARLNLAMTLASEQQFEQALKQFELALGPAAAHHNIGLILFKAGRKDEALNHLQKAAQIDPSLDSQTLLSTLYENTAGRSVIIPASYTE